MSGPNYDDMDADKLRHLLKIRDRQAETSRKFWVRAAEKALAGDPRELRLRVDLANAPPMELVLSASEPPHEP